MGIADKFRGGYGRQKFAAADIQDNGNIGYGDTGRWSHRQWRRCGTGNRSDGDGKEL